MTNKEAVKWIRLDIEMAKFDPSTGEEAYLNDDARKVIEAQEIAIKALEQLEPCKDTISREAVSEWLKQYGQDVLHGKYEVSLMYVWKNLMNLPSIQPEIIRCKDCKHKPYPSDDYDYDNDDCGFEIIFPDYRCPCRCEDEYYNHIPDDDWFCGNAERRTDEQSD